MTESFAIGMIFMLMGAGFSALFGYTLALCHTADDRIEDVYRQSDDASSRIHEMTREAFIEMARRTFEQEGPRDH